MFINGNSPSQINFEKKNGPSGNIFELRPSITTGVKERLGRAAENEKKRLVAATAGDDCSPGRACLFTAPDGLAK